jgi:SAM-dependent methyltransferase
MLGLYRKLLGHPFVYDRVRPAVVGGIDMAPLYAELAGEPSQAVLDVGCGTGDALRHLRGFESYLGVDTDPVAIDAAKARWGGESGVRFEARMLRADDITTLAPTGVVLSGVLHHLTNDEAVDVLRMVAASPRLRRVVTSDIVFLPGKLFNNVLAMMDRGRYCRDPDAYAGLARRAGLVVERAFVIDSAPGNERVQYFIMALSPGSASA